MTNNSDASCKVSRKRALLIPLVVGGVAGLLMISVIAPTMLYLGGSGLAPEELAAGFMGVFYVILAIAIVFIAIIPSYSCLSGDGLRLHNWERSIRLTRSQLSRNLWDWRLLPPASRRCGAVL